MTRAHVIAWRGSFAPRDLVPATVQRKLSAISSLFDARKALMRARRWRSEMPRLERGSRLPTRRPSRASATGPS